MSSAASRSMVWTSGGVGFAVLLVFALMFRERLVEEWQLSRLRSADPHVRRGAIERLSAMESPRTLTALYSIANDPDENRGVRQDAAEAMQRVASRIRAGVRWEPLIFSERLNQPDS